MSKFNVGERLFEIKEKILKIVKEDLGLVLEEKASLIDSQKRLKRLKVSRFDLGSEGKFNNLIMEFNFSVLKHIDVLDEDLLNSVIKMFDYEGYILHSPFYYDIVEILVEGNKKLLADFDYYIDEHNNQVVDQRQNLDFESFDGVKSYLLAIIMDNKLLAESLESKISSNYEGLKMLDLMIGAPDAKKSKKAEIMESNNRYSKTYKNYSSSKEIIKLYNFISGTDDKKITEKHIRIFNSMPLIVEDEKELFFEYAKLIDEKIQCKEDKRRKPVEKKLDPSPIIVEEEIEFLPVEDEPVIPDYEEVELKEITILEESKTIFLNILAGNKMEHILSMLPKFSNPNYYKIRNDLYYLISDEEDTIKSLIDDFSNVDDDFLNDLTLLHNAKDYLDAYFIEEEQIEIDDELVKVNDEMTLYFALRSNNVPYVLGDLKKLCEEDKAKAEILFNLISSGYESNNVLKQRKFRDMDKIAEIKYDNARLVYKLLYGKNVIILGFYIKKADTTQKISRSIVKRDLHTCDQSDSHKQRIKCEATTVEILKEQMGYFTECMSAVFTNKKGKKPNGN